VKRREERNPVFLMALLLKIFFLLPIFVVVAFVVVVAIGTVRVVVVDWDYGLYAFGRRQTHTGGYSIDGFPFIAGCAARTELKP